MHLANTFAQVHMLITKIGIYSLDNTITNFVNIDIHLPDTLIDDTNLTNTDTLKPRLHIANTFMHITTIYFQLTQIDIRIWMIAWEKEFDAKVEIRRAKKHQKTDMRHRAGKKNGIQIGSI